MNKNFYNFFIKFWTCRKVARSIEETPPYLVVSPQLTLSYWDLSWRPSGSLQQPPLLCSPCSLGYRCSCLLSLWLTVVSLNPAAAFSAPSRITHDNNSLPVPSFRRLQWSALSSVKAALWIPQSVFWVSDSSWGHTYGYPKHRLVGPGVNFTAFQLGESGLVPEYGACPAWGTLTHSVQTNLSFSREDVAPLTF